MKIISTLIFDLDGTLADSAADLAQAVNFTLERLGLPAKSQEKIMGYIGDGMTTLLERATGYSAEADLARSIKIFRPYYFENCTVQTRLYPGVREILKHFESFPKGVVTNKPLAMTQKILDHFKIAAYFSSVVGGESTQKKKPDPEPVLKALKDLRADPQASLMIGDGTTDIEAGRRAGTRTCAVAYGYRSREELERLNPNYIVEHLIELKDLHIWH